MHLILSNCFIRLFHITSTLSFSLRKKDIYILNFTLLMSRICNQCRIGWYSQLNVHNIIFAQGVIIAIIQMPLHSKPETLNNIYILPIILSTNY